MSAITERVAKGAAFLDEHDPGWWRADVDRPIDLDRLNLAETDLCVLGQRCPLEILAKDLGLPAGVELEAPDFEAAYTAYARRLSGLPFGDRLTEWGTDHGFVAEDGRPSWARSWTDLTDEWKRVITGRRSAS